MALTSVEHIILGAVKRKNEGCRPIHISQFNWPIQVSLVEVECVSIRKLTLLEEFTLKSFNEIPDVSANQIAMELGLEAKLIEETLDNLEASDAIEVQKDLSYQSNDISELKDEKVRLELEISQDEHRYGFANVDRQKRNRVKLLRKRIMQLEAEDSESVRGTSWKALFKNAYEKLKGYVANVTPRGKENLAKGLIDMPPTMKTLRLCRCPISGNVFPFNEYYFKQEQLYKLNGAVTPYNRENIQAVEVLRDEDVKKAFEKGRSLDTEVEIKSQRILDDDYELEGIQIFATAYLDKSGKLNWSVMTEKGKTLVWAQDELNINKEMQSQLLKSLPKTKSNHKVNFNKIRLEQTSLSDMLEIINQSKSIILREPLDLSDNDRKALNAAIEANGPAIFEVRSDDESPTGVIKDEPLHVRIESSIVQDWVLAGEFGAIMPGYTEIKIGDKSQKIKVNHKDENGKLFDSVLHEIRDTLEPRIRFRLSQSEEDFDDWVEYEFAKVSDFATLESSIQFLRSASGAAQFNVDNMIMERMRPLLSSIMNLDDINELQQISNLSESLGLDLWSSAAANLQKSILVGGGDESESWKTWINHDKGTNRLSYEDAARLENYLFANCDKTAVEVLRIFEKSLRKLAAINGVVAGGDLSNIIDGLEKENIIDIGMKQQMHDIRKNRNKFIHTEGERATLPEVLKTTVLIRVIRSILQEDGWIEDQKIVWDEVLDEKAMKEIISVVVNKCTELHELGLKLDGELWTRPLINRTPKSFTELDIEILQTIAAAPEFNTEPQFSELGVKIAENSVDAFISQYPAKQIPLPSIILTKLRQVKELGLDSVAKVILEKVIAEIPLPNSASRLLEEAGNTAFIDEVLKPMELNSRWSSAIAEKGFICNFNELASGLQEGIDRLTNKPKQKLLTEAVSSWHKSLKRGEIEALQPLAEQLHQMSNNDGWSNQITKIDGQLENMVRRQMSTSDSPVKAAKILVKIHAEDSPLFPEQLKRCNSHIMKFIEENLEVKE